LTIEQPAPPLSVVCQRDVFDAFHGRVLSDPSHPDGHSSSLMKVQPGLRPLLLTLRLGYRKHLNMLVSFPSQFGYCFIRKDRTISS